MATSTIDFEHDGDKMFVICNEQGEPMEWGFADSPTISVPFYLLREDAQEKARQTIAQKKGE